MKPAPFDYVRPASLEEACEILAANGDARLIAGGQTLIPLMAMRLAQPSLLVDIARIPALAIIHDDGHFITIGAATRQCVVEHDSTVRAKAPLLAAAMPWVGHSATRARGTVGGSLANADPASEITLVASVLDATITYRDGAADCATPANMFVTGPMTTTLPGSACLTSVRFPIWHDGRIGTGFHEVSARPHDFAIASAAAQVALDKDGRCLRLAAGVGAVTDRPLRLELDEVLQGTVFDEAACRSSVTEALADIELFSDLHATSSYRRRVAIELAVRAIAEAFANASLEIRDAH